MVESAADTPGLICAFRLAPLAPVVGDPYAATGDPESPLWLHFNLADNRVRRYLETQEVLGEDGRELLLDRGTRPQVRTLGHAFAAVLSDLHHDFKADPENFGTVRVYLDAGLIITGRTHRVRAVGRARVRLEASDAPSSPLELFEWILDDIVGGFAALAADLADTVEETEDRILAGRSKDQSSELGRIRRLLARLRRHASGNRGVLTVLVQRATNVFDPEHRQQLREVIERFDGLAQDIELATERARLLQEEIATRLGEATNRNLYVLSVVTTALLPITLVTGIFGMNVTNLPFADSAHGFAHVMLIMSIILLGTMLFLRRMNAGER